MNITTLDEEIKIITITCARIMDVHKKEKSFVSVHRGARWVKSA